MAKKLNNQTAFNRVWRHFVVRKHPLGADKNGTCRYRWHGKKCAVGVLIPDSLYEKEIEHSPVIFALNRPRIRSHLHGVSLAFLRALQDRHDTAAEKGTGSDGLEYGLRRVAKAFNLKVPR